MGASKSDYDPPLTLAPQQSRIRTTAHYACGVEPGGTVPAVGHMEGVAPEASCLGVNSSRLTETVRYGDGKHSVIVYTRNTTVRVAGAITIRLSGEVTEGRGKGQAARRTVSGLPEQLPTECLSSGLTGSTGWAQLEIHP
ncbi:hypothetical protein ACFQ2B_12040 [Streptomyces stramineus]